MQTAHKIITRTLAAAALVAAAGAVQAQQGGPYLLIGGGFSDFNLDCSGTSRCDDSGNVLQLIGGYRFGNGFAAEGLYVNLGKVSAAAGNVGLTLKGSALGAGGAYTAEFSPAWGATVRLGLASVKLQGDAFIGSLSGSVSETKANPYLGVGLHYKFNKVNAVELGFLRTRGEVVGDEGDLSAITVSLRLVF